ncbi:MAG: putative ATPase [Urechidicola sp.]|jgi:predicted ATPase
MHLKNIGVENFRVFGEKTEFSFRPITVLTGKNSSGKSSLNKLLLLLKQNYGVYKDLNSLKLGDELSNLHSSEKIKSWGIEADRVTIEFDFPLNHFEGNSTLHLSYNFKKKQSLNLSLIEIRNEGKMLIKYHHMYDAENGEEFSLCSCELNHKLILDTFNRLVEEEKRSAEKRKSDRDRAVKDYKKQIKEGGYWFLSHPQEEEPSEEFVNFGYLSLENVFGSGYSGLNIASFLEEELLFSCDHEGKPVDLSDFSELFSLGEEMFTPKTFNCIDWDSSDSYSEDCLGDLFKQLKLPLHWFYIQDKVEHATGLTGVTINPSERNKKIVKELIADNIKYSFDALKEVFRGLEYISPHRGNQNRVLSSSSNRTDIEAIVNEFGLKIHLDNSNNKVIIEFIEDSLSLFGLKAKIDIKRIEDVASVLYLIIDKRRVLLSDIGYGYAQLIPILLKIGLIASDSMQGLDWESRALREGISYGSSLLILEEPEANLHPDFQSKLADVIVSAGKKFNIQFIVETHSEYFIRKLQYLTAKKDILPEHTVIYYFYNPTDIPKGESQVNEINITPNGGLTDSFGTGFFDEATNIKMELLRINQIQKN